MKLRFSSVCFVWATVVVVTAASGQDTKSQIISTYRAGGLSFSIPAPTADLVETGPDYRVLLETFAPNSNRLIAAFIAPQDLAILQTGKVPMPSQYALVEVPRGAEFVDVNDDQFGQVREGLSQQYEANLESGLKKGTDEVNEKEKALTGKESNLQIDKPTQLGRFFTKPNADGFGMILPLSGNGISLRRAMGFALLRVNHRILFVYFYMDYKDEDTVKVVRATLEKWTDAILTAN